MTLLTRVRRRLARRHDVPVAFEGTFPFFNVLEVLLKDVADIENVRFLQIGAADGKTEDPISEMVRRYGWSGTLVEPSPGPFARLQETYADCEGLRFAQYVVTDTQGQTELPFYQVREDIRRLTHWADQSSSLNRDVVRSFLGYLSTTELGKHLHGDPDGAIEEIRLPTKYIGDLVEECCPAELDLLVVDTMGYDARILKAFPFDRVAPRVVMFEHFLISAEEKRDVLSHLASKGYAFVKFAVDTIAVKTEHARVWSVSEW